MSCQASGPITSTRTFICVGCNQELDAERAAWDTDPELPATICLDCMDDAAPTPTPEFTREVA